MAWVSKDREEVFFDYDIDVPGRTIWCGSSERAHEDDDYGTGVDFVMAERVIKGLHLLESSGKNSAKPIKILMSNPGGCDYSGMGIYDAIDLCRSPVTIIGIGKVWSMATYIMQAAAERVLTENCSFMFHAGSWGYGWQHPKNIKNWVKFEEAMAKRMDAILFNPMQKKNPSLTWEEFEKMNDFDTILTAQQTIDMGLADRLAQKGEIGDLIAGLQKRGIRKKKKKPVRKK